MQNENIFGPLASLATIRELRFGTGILVTAGDGAASGHTISAGTETSSLPGAAWRPAAITAREALSRQYKTRIRRLIFARAQVRRVTLSSLLDGAA